MIFVDEAGFYLLPAAVRTYAPCGETPELRYRFWEHVSVISAITPQGKLFTTTQKETFKGPTIVRFLKHLLRHIPGKLLVLHTAVGLLKGSCMKVEHAAFIWRNCQVMHPI